MEFFAGIDGGGTKTALECRDRQGRVLLRQTFGPFNFNSIGAERFDGLLEELTAALAALGTCVGLCAGAAGISNPRVREHFSRAMDRAGIARWSLVGDQEIALYGALEGAAGCGVIAGTGSICFGRDGAGRAARAGGWGHLLDDEGSGYALGRDALSAVLRQWDGRGPETLLTRLVSEKLGAGGPGDIVAYAYAGDKSRIAAIAPLTEQAARAGDGAAASILEKGGRELALQVRAVAGALGLREVPVALMGGLLAHDTGLRRALTERLAVERPDLHCIAPKQDAAAGAAMMAQKLAE